MDLHEALGEIATIRRQLACSERFRGYRAAPVAASGLWAFAAGAVQAIWIPDAWGQFDRYLALWISVATASAIVCLGDIWLRYYRRGGRLTQETTELAVGQFFPCLAAGALLTMVVAEMTPQVAWMLPGLWAILFSLGLFASARWLARGILGVAAWYLASGLYVLSLGSAAPAPWTMPLVFGVGQLLTAAVLLLAERQTSGDEA